MKRILISLVILISSLAASAQSPTEGVISHGFVAEEQMQHDLLQMLADFTAYMTANVAEVNDSMITFRGENTFGNNEQGVRHNADMGMICAFLVKYGKGKVTLPEGVTWARLEDLARRSLAYSVATHRANKFYPCKDNRYWGSAAGAGQWESSLWAMSVAYSAFFQWDKLTPEEKIAVEALLVSECEYELARDIPTGYKGDTKAEENGWEADVLAAALGLFPDHEKAPQWFGRLREFAVNSYSHPSDSLDRTVIDPEYDTKTVADLYLGANLYPDYTLQNHDFFHTSYQNVVMQELGEAALALKLFQTELYGKEKWKTNALMHNNQAVMDNVLNRLALADGELAMPNGNDWSLFLFDQITSYSTAACFLRDPNALFLENMAYKYIKARQQTTGDGSWLLRPDVGARRMGVEGHRVMMTWLMHHALPTDGVKAAEWNDFRREWGKTKYFENQNLVAGTSPDRFATFSWGDGIRSYTGYVTSTNPDNNKIIVPYRANNSGNFIGWYEVDGRKTDAVPVVEGIYQMNDSSWIMNGEINTNGSALSNRFAIYSTASNAVIYLDYVRANEDARITAAKGGLMAISTDEFTKTSRRLHWRGGAQTTDGSALTELPSEWVNIDGEIGIVASGNEGMAFGDRANNNSIMTSKIYPLYSGREREVKAGETVDSRCVIYYMSVDSAATARLSAASQRLVLPEGWNGVMAAEPDGSYNLFVANFAGADSAGADGLSTSAGAPVFDIPAKIKDGKSTVSFTLSQNASFGCAVRAFIRGTDVIARRTPDGILIENTGRNNNTIAISGIGIPGRKIKLARGETICVK